MFTPVFPPIDESTWDNKVVGMLTNFKPLLNRLAAKPLTSPVIPPPIDIKQSFLEKFLFNKILRILLTLCVFLFSSFALKKYM